MDYIDYNLYIFSDIERAQHFGRKEAANKKKRKSRTAFTNSQIFELEKRFLYQKYLSPADRDEIALGLGLSNGQVSLQIKHLNFGLDFDRFSFY